MPEPGQMAGRSGYACVPPTYSAAPSPTAACTTTWSTCRRASSVRLAICWISALIGLLVKTPQGVQTFGFTAMFPIVFASGLLVPLATMPGWLQAFAKANPMTLLAAACRGLMTGGPVAVPAGE